jgi:hypothetical protein
VRHFDPAEVSSGSCASLRYARDARGMSAMPSTATELVLRNEPSRCARTGLMHCSKNWCLGLDVRHGLARIQIPEIGVDAPINIRHATLAIRYVAHAMRCGVHNPIAAIAALSKKRKIPRAVCISSDR